MAVNATKAEQQKQLAEDFANKLALEPRLVRDLSVIFHDVADVYEAELQTTGAILDASDFEVDIRGALKAQYRRVNRKFGRQIRRQIKTFSANIETKGTNDDITKEQSDFINEQSESHAELIIGTLQNQLNTIPQNIVRVATEVSPLTVFDPISQDELARQSANKLRSLIPGKSRIIAGEETQQAAEALKNIESRTLSRDKVIRVLKKVWTSILDERTRFSHGVADGQVQNENDPFIVQGQFLMFPTDTNLGATLDNVMGCRCSSITVWELF